MRKTILISLVPVFMIATAVWAAVPLFETPVDYAVGDAPRAVCAGDFNKDGFPDLAVANRDSHDISIFLNDQFGAFGSAVTLAADSAPSGICTADFDDDTHLDLAVCNAVADSVSVFYNDGFGSFSAGIDFPAGAGNCYPRGICAADLDDDGFVDLAVANEWADSVAVLINNQDGSFALPVSYPLGADTEPYAVCAADLDDDGFIDLVTANFLSDNITVLINNGDGTFAAAAPYSVGDGPRSVAAGYLDGDGLLDLAVTNFVSHNVSVLLNAGGGTFPSVSNYPNGSNPRSICLAMLDDDTELDMVSANWISGNVSVFLNNGDGTFGDDEIFTAGSGPTALISADFDGDTDYDLAVTVLDADSVAILMNTTAPEVGVIDVAGDGLPGRFSLAQNYPNPFNPGTRIGFSLPQRSSVAISVFNINGQMVRKLLDEELAAGDHEVWWDGCDDAGRALATGIYLYRLNAGESIQTRKMVLLK